CAPASSAQARILEAATLIPAEGARTLATWQGSLIELCGNGARQIYRKFPVEEIAATDSVGRPLVMRAKTLFRWSPVNGWRKLFTVPDVPVPEKALPSNE